MKEQSGQLRKLVEQQKQQIINRLLSAGIYKLYDGRDLYEGTLTELECEMQFMNSGNRRRSYSGL